MNNIMPPPSVTRELYCFRHCQLIFSFAVVRFFKVGTWGVPATLPNLFVIIAMQIIHQ